VLVRAGQTACRWFPRAINLPRERVPEEGEDESRLLLRFAAPRDPVMVAEWVSFNVIDTEKQDWARG